MIRCSQRPRSFDIFAAAQVSIPHTGYHMSRESAARSTQPVRCFLWLSPHFRQTCIESWFCGCERATGAGLEKKGPALSNETLGHLEKSNLIECRCSASGRRKFAHGRDILLRPRLRTGWPSGPPVTAGARWEVDPTRGALLRRACSVQLSYECDGATIAHSVRPGRPGQAPAPVPSSVPRPSAPEGNGASGPASQASMSRHTVSACRSRVSM
jgi:hypothetical protein